MRIYSIQNLIGPYLKKCCLALGHFSQSLVSFVKGLCLHSNIHMEFTNKEAFYNGLFVFTNVFIVVCNKNLF